MKQSLQRTVSPIDGSIYVERQLASGGDIENALEKAVAAQRAWKSIRVSERVQICRRMTSWCVERAEELAKELTWQMGRPVAHSPFELRRGFAERANHMADIAEATLADVEVEPKENFQRFIRRESLGVTLVIAPWNYPWLTSVNAVVPALIAGNSVIL
jgi:acyl-CoA reductase-like NAD-dependent aldehyde dehydrogenase